MPILHWLDRDKHVKAAEDPIIAGVANEAPPQTDEACVRVGRWSPISSV
jgi:hypothetical protein